MNYVWWFSPHLDNVFSYCVYVFVKDVGEITQGRSNKFTTLVLPSLNRFCFIGY